MASFQPDPRLEGLDAVVHLAGAGIADRRWTAARRETLLRSRVDGTRFLIEALQQLGHPPTAFVQASAIGWYGDRGDEILTEEGAGERADLKGALEFLNRVTRRKVVVFLISDFLSPDFDQALHVTSKRHDLVPLLLTDPAEEVMAQVGLVSVQDAASSALSFFDFGRAGVAKYKAAQAARAEVLLSTFKRYGVSHIQVKTNDLDYAAPLLNYFKIRAKRS